MECYTTYQRKNSKKYGEKIVRNIIKDLKPKKVESLPPPITIEYICCKCKTKEVRHINLDKMIWGRCYMRVKRKLGRKPTSEELQDCIKNEPRIRLQTARKSITRSYIRYYHTLEKQLKRKPTQDEFKNYLIKKGLNVLD